MGFFEEQDNQGMIDQLGEPITIGGVTANAVVRTPDEELLRSDAELAPLIGRIYEFVMKTGAFPALATGVSVTRGTETYLVRRITTTGQGAFTHALGALV